MKKKILFYIILSFAFIFLCLGKAIPAKADYDASNDVKSIIDGIIFFNTGNTEDSSEAVSKESRDIKIKEYVENTLPNNIGGTAEWYALGLYQYGDYDFTAYRKALVNYLSEKEIGGASTRLKFALLLAFVSDDGDIDKATGRLYDSDFIEKALNDDSIGGQGIMSYVFGLHLYNNGYKGAVSEEEIIDTFRELQHEDGGWSVMGDNGDVDVTAMVLQALAPLTDKAFVPDPGNTETGLTEYTASIITMAKRGIEFLSEKQDDDGGYAGFGVKNAESTAQVIAAMSALGIDCATDARFVKNGNSPIDGIAKFKLEDGSFSHDESGVSSPSATVQTFYSMVAYLRMKEGLSPLYVKDSNEKKLVEIYGEKINTDTQDEKDGNEPGINTDSDGNNGDKSDTYNNGFNSDSSNKNDVIDKTPNDNNVSSGSGYKPIAIAILAGVCLLICGILFALKKHWKNYLFVGIVGIIGVLIIILTDFSKPEDYYGKATDKENTVGTVTMSIRCDILKDKERNEHIPEDYCILDTTEFKISENESVYDILLEAAKEYSISVEHEGGSDIVYISGINYLYENDYGDLSGWVYKVNGVLPSVGCGGYKLKDGDIIEWCYTLDLGNDVS